MLLGYLSSFTYGSRLVAEATLKLTSMVEGVRENGSLIEGIASASQDQANAIGEVTAAIRQMDETTQHNAALVEETNAAIEQTESQVSDLDRIVSVFVVEGGDRQATRREAQPAAAQRKGGIKALQAKVKSAAKSYLSNGGAAIKEDWTGF